MAREVNHPIIASGTVAANLLRFSNATGAYFVDTTDATLAAALAAAVKHNDIVEVLDGSKRAIRFVAKSQGTGETLGVEIVTNWNFDSGDTGWTKQAGWTVADQGAGDYMGVATGAGDATQLYQAYAGSVAGRLVKTAGIVSAFGSGGVKFMGGSVRFAPVTGNGTHLFYSTETSGTMYASAMASGVTTLKITSLSLKQVLTPSASGVLASKYPGGADGFSNVAASFGYNSATGFTWRVISSVPNGKTVYSNAITPSAMHASMVNGAAFFFDDTIDFSSFAIGPSGKYLIAMYDSAGRVAWGYGKAVGVTTDPTPFGLTITSTPDGETYNWAQITTGFNADAVTSVKVWRAL